MDRSNYYATNQVGLEGVIRSAKMAYENSGQHSVIHMHAMDDPCNRGCEPYPLMAERKTNG